MREVYLNLLGQPGQATTTAIRKAWSHSMLPLSLMRLSTATATGHGRETHVFANQFFGGNAPRPPFPPFAFGAGAVPPQTQDAGPIPHVHSFHPPRPRERKQWTVPAAPGPTLRSRVEQREREVGLRCSDTSCGIGPSDEDPFPEMSDASMKQLSIRPLPNSTVPSTSVCSHTFHPACLVSAERVAGWGGEDKKEQLVEVSCPNCRAVGCVERNEWEEGVRGLA